MELGIQYRPSSHWKDRFYVGTYYERQEEQKSYSGKNDEICRTVSTTENLADGHVEQRRKAIAKFEKEKKAYWRRQEQRPTRKRGYIFSCQPDAYGNAEEWVTLRFLRILGQVNCQFRTELARVFYTDIHVEVANDSLGSLPTEVATLLPFLDDQPSILNSINSIGMDIYAAEENNDESEARKALNFVHICQRVRKTLKLKDFHFSVCFTVCRVREFVEDKGDFQWLRQIRRLPVSSSFNFRLEIVYREEVDDLKDLDQKEFERRVEDEYHDRVKDILMPRSLINAAKALEV